MCSFQEVASAPFKLYRIASFKLEQAAYISRIMNTGKMIMVVYMPLNKFFYPPSSIRNPHHLS
jgi:hypothetical protein